MAETNHRRLDYCSKIPVSSVLLVKKGLEKCQIVPEDQSFPGCRLSRSRLFNVACISRIGKQNSSGLPCATEMNPLQWP